MTLPDGWLNDDDQAELRRIAKNKVVLELGAFKGRSTVVLAEVAHYVVSVDRHRGVNGVESLDDYLGAVRGLGNVAVVIADFAPIVDLFGCSFDVVFVDGDHDADSVERDARSAIARLNPRKGGTVCFHDWDFESVREGAGRVLFPADPTAVRGSVASFSL